MSDNEAFTYQTTANSCSDLSILAHNAVKGERVKGSEKVAPLYAYIFFIYTSLHTCMRILTRMRAFLYIVIYIIFIIYIISLYIPFTLSPFYPILSTKRGGESPVWKGIYGAWTFHPFTLLPDLAQKNGGVSPVKSIITWLHPIRESSTDCLQRGHHNADMTYAPRLIAVSTYDERIPAPG